MIAFNAIRKRPRVCQRGWGNATGRCSTGPMLLLLLILLLLHLTLCWDPHASMNGMHAIVPCACQGNGHRSPAVHLVARLCWGVSTQSVGQSIARYRTFTHRTCTISTGYIRRANIVSFIGSALVV